MIRSFQNKTKRMVQSSINAMLGRISSVFASRNAASVEGYDEDREIPIASPYGVQGLPPVGTEAQVIYNWGSRHQVVIVGTIVSVTPKLEPGESQLFSEGGARVHCKKDGSVVINEGTKGVARVGDQIEVDIGGTIYKGTIKTGSSNFMA